MRCLLDDVTGKNWASDPFADKPLVLASNVASGTRNTKRPGGFPPGLLLCYG